MSVYHRSQGKLTTWMCLGIGFLVKLKKNLGSFLITFLKHKCVSMETVHGALSLENGM